MERPLPLAYDGRPTIAVSRSTREDLVTRGLRAPTEVIPIGVDTAHYMPHPERHRTPGPSLFYLGRLKRYKGVDLLVRAVARLAWEGLRVVFLVAGAGDARPELERLAEEEGVGD